MLKLTTLMRGLLLVPLLIAGAMSAAPAFAAPSDIDLLKQYVGSWHGRGTLSGANTETIVCRLSILEGNADKVNYSGRCTLAGTTLSINGTIAYITERKRFEAAMTSNVTFSGTAIGQKRGDGIVFDLKEKEKDDKGNDMNVAATMTLAGGKINVAFQVVFADSGDLIKAQVPFTK